MANAADHADAADLADRVRAGDRNAIARAMTLLERLSPASSSLIAGLEPRLGQASVIGITGPPGVGKSTLVNALIVELRARARTIGVIAVDPSSPISGGAILGDRVRMTAAMDDDGVFVRSLASRGYLGGLSPAAVRMIDVLDAAGFDDILLETVGAGQSEIDIATIADVRIVVLAPGLGDDIQAMKSGLIEIADILVVNKGDVHAAESTRLQLLSAVSIRAREAATVPVLKTTATTGDGIGDLVAAITTAAARARATPVSERRRRRARYLIARAAADLVAARLASGPTGELDRLADEVLDAKLMPGDAAKRLLAG